jgi:hypothetical protein
MVVYIDILIEHTGSNPGERFPIVNRDSSLQDKLKTGVTKQVWARLLQLVM